MNHYRTANWFHPCKREASYKTHTYTHTDNMQFFVWRGSQNLCQTMSIQIINRSEGFCSGILGCLCKGAFIIYGREKNPKIMCIQNTPPSPEITIKGQLKAVSFSCPLNFCTEICPPPLISLHSYLCLPPPW